MLQICLVTAQLLPAYAQVIPSSEHLLEAEVHFFEGIPLACRVQRLQVGLISGVPCRCLAPAEGPPLPDAPQALPAEQAQAAGTDMIAQELLSVS